MHNQWKHEEIEQKYNKYYYFRRKNFETLC